MQKALLQAGFFGVEMAAGVIYARSRPELPEVTALAEGEAYLLGFAWPLRATAAQIAEWNALHPAVRMDIHQGETRIRTYAAAEPTALRDWAGVIDEMVAQCTLWRRATRQRDEGM
jgi:hypothetical protein